MGNLAKPKGLPCFFMEKELFHRNQIMDVLRILACMGVILAHVGAMCFTLNIVEKGTAEWVMCYVVKKMLLFSVPIFAMLTGFFFLNPEKELPLSRLYGKNIARLVLALVFWTLFNAVTIHSGYYPFGGVETNFWYVGMCIGLYVSMPVLRRVAENEKLLSYSCWIWLFIQCYYYIGKYVKLPLVFTDYVFTEFVGYCLWGYYMYQHEWSRKQTRIIYFLGSIACVATIVVPLLTNGKVSFDYTGPAPILAVFAIFLFFTRHQINLSYRFERILTHFSKATFGIYMAHSFVVVAVFSRLYRFIPNTIALVPVGFVLIFGLSYAITFIIKKIPILQNWIV